MIIRWLIRPLLTVLSLVLVLLGLADPQTRRVAGGDQHGQSGQPVDGFARPDSIEAWWSLLNWNEVNRHYGVTS